MIKRKNNFSSLLGRRRFCQSLFLASTLCSPGLRANSPSSVTAAGSCTLKKIPSSGEQLPAIGMGSWITFDIPYSEVVWNQRVQVLQAFFDHGGGIIDSSPMYGFAEEAIGYCLERIQNGESLFAASKIWTPASFMGSSQMGNTESLWGVKPMDLMFVHNLLAWRKHLPRLQEWQAEGRVRYIGLSTSHGRRHTELEKIMRSEKVDFIQLTLNIEQVEAERRLLPLAADLGIAVIINRPFQRGALIDRYNAKALPAIAAELGCENWAQYLLLYIISHPAVTCAIPATSKVAHMQENMSTLKLAMPDQHLRREMRRQIS